MGYAPAGGLDVYYEEHGEGDPLLLLHGALATIETSFATVLPELAKSRRVLAVEQQGHGRTRAADRPLTLESMADDTAAVLDHLGTGPLDVLGYDLGAGVALHLAARRPDLVRRLVFVGHAFDRDGFHPGVLDGVARLTPAMLAGSPFERAYAAVAPDPSGFAALVERTTALETGMTDLTSDEVRALAAPTLVVVGDADLVTPEHAVRMFRLRGGGVPGDLVGLPPSQLAVLPGTSHAGLLARPDLLLGLVLPFLQAP
ncbi:MULTISPECIES: alpha/beta fold hydrolase [unclassified Micromonospora]|uniref:alpha/beta fold hydrolase n=1 Tax=unclassified Micromonospora TaxID=2617518 RepID=UPI00249BCB1D|nr:MULTISPECIES: alpha/beta fold hydrolase [unclassified Micromonospora]WFE54781.1 alpha/beta fold hydrolase [Micromonospora sp. WMMD1155]WFE98697.1 alpha/beta fold hydrolase [Micromonospora sp. WMMD964]